MRLRKMRLEYLLALQNGGAQLSDDDDDDLDEYGQMPFLPMGDMESLSPQERKRLRKANKNMPAYLFMTDSEKQAFFRKKSETFNRKLESMEVRPCKTKKIVKFQNSFEVKPFNKQQPVIRIKSTPCFKDNYHPEHFS